MTKFLMVDVASITSSLPRSNFQEADLDIMADMILESGGIIKPLVLEKIGFEKYEVIDGHFEYYAAVKAREKNPSEGEMVNALIITPEKQEAILKQAKVIQELENHNKLAEKNTVEATNISRSVINEFYFEKQINELRSELAQERQERHKLYDILNEIESQVPKQIPLLEAFNNLPLVELTFQLRTAGNFSDEKIAKIVESIEKERKKKKFMSLSDVIARVKITSGKKQIKGITSDKMVDIVDTWSRLLFL
ncbi:MAG: chromosome partitioning protein ParB [Hapalosiphonaceae cyanobacterium JJU2]|nr:MAG: chromosome partitioning protein ParB [Hapalosiphonaceae cyanobacterium JJU2]